MRRAPSTAPVTLTILATAAGVILQPGCGGSSFAGKAQPTPTPTPAPVEAKPLVNHPGEDSTGGPQVLGNASRTKPGPTGTPTGVTFGTGGTTPVLGVGGSTAQITFPSNVAAPVLIPASSEPPRFVNNAPSNSVAIRVRCPIGVLGLVIDDVCIEALHLHAWSSASRAFFDTAVDAAACAGAAQAGCGGHALHENGFSYKGKFAFVFPESSKTKLTEVGVPTATLVICRGGLGAGAAGDDYIFNPGTAEQARIAKCGAGSQRFLVVTSTRQGFQPLYELAAPDGRRTLSLGAASSPYLGGTLEPSGLAGYVVTP